MNFKHCTGIAPVPKFISIQELKEIGEIEILVPTAGIEPTSVRCKHTALPLDEAGKIGSVGRTCTFILKVMSLAFFY
jgi:hypothetical protein